MDRNPTRFSIFFIAVFLMTATASLLIPASASAQLWEAGAGGGFPPAERDDWRFNNGPFSSAAAATQRAYDWCKTTNQYANTALDCEAHPGFPDSIIWIEGGGALQNYWQLDVNMYRNGGYHGTVRVRWFRDDTSDDDCQAVVDGEVMDRATDDDNPYDCIDGGELAKIAAPDPISPPCNESNPCHPANGNKSQREVDHARNGSGGVTFARQYNSMGAYKTGQGMPAGWRHTYSRAMNENPDRLPTVFFAAPADESSFYYSASDACDLGWDDIKATVWSGDLSTATSSFSGGNQCKISMGGSTVAYFPIRSGAAWSGFTPPSGTHTITRANGSSVKFELVGSVWVNQLNPALKLESSGSNWVFTDTNDTQETYNSSGQLTTITYRNGQAETLEYNLTAAQGGDDDGDTLDKVTGEFGHAITFDYDVDGYLSSVTTADGTINYAMDANDNLISVTYPDTSVRQYEYEDTTLPNHLTGIIDENNDRFATWAYDSAGRAISSEHAGGKEQVLLAYNTDGTTTLTMANGAVRTYTYTTEQGERRIASLAGDVCSTCPGGTIKGRSYDSNGFVADVTDWNGNVTKTARNARGLVETLNEAFGTPEQRVTTTLWHPSLRLPTKVTSPQNVTDYTYDSSGNVLTITLSGGGDTRVWTLTYNANGQPLTINGPRTDVTDTTTLTYYTCTTGNECGQLKSVTNALGHVTNYDTYDSAGRLTKMTEPNGLETTLTYDTRGRVLTVTQTPTVGTARVTTMTYDDVGQLETYTLPNSAVLTYAYDAAHYLTSITDNLGNYITYSTDSMGSPLEEKTYDPLSSLSRSIAYTHDDNYRLDTIASGGFTTDLAFDLMGNLTTETDPDSAVTQHLYDALNRLESSTDALSGVTDFTYDDHDNVTQVEAPNGAVTDYVYSALDDLDSEASADRGSLTYTYDDAGNRLTMTDARSVTATYTYDALNRVSTISYPDTSENVTYAYDVVASNGVGRLTSIVDESGTTTYTYDEFGNVATDARLISGVTYTTSYQYDGANKISSITYPSGRVVDYVRDTAGQITLAKSTKSSVVKNLVSSASYDPFGPVTSLTYGNGVVYDYAYGLDNRISTIDSSSIADKDYTYDGAGRIAAINDSVNTGIHQNFGYDVLGRVTSETSPSEYASRVLADNPIAYWRLDEAIGTNAADVSGYDRDATYVGAVVFGESGLIVGSETAIRVNGVGDGYVAGPTLSGVTVTGIEAWIQTDATGSSREFLNLYKSDSDAIAVSHHHDGTVKIEKYKSGYVMVSDGIVSTGQPHHVAVWYESAPNKTYMMIDGVVQQITYTGNLLAVIDPKVHFGALEYKSNMYERYPGNIDEVAIYDSAVTAGTFANRSVPITPGTPLSNTSTIELGYDANGNRTSLDDGSSVETLSYSSLSNRLTSIDASSVGHDLAGNRTSDQGGTRTYTYSDANRLAQVLISGSPIATYVHNALGQRATKSAESDDIVYLYDLFGNLIAEHTDAGVLIRDYVWMNDMPVAQIDAGEVFSYLHLDHLNTPRLATNDSQTIVWRWDSDAFGSALPDEDPDNDSNTTTVNLRFPGQYYDDETGLHYNYFRTYDPSTGRYLESDPIGLRGGLNTYSYAMQNPLSLFDPTGEDSIRAKILEAIGRGDMETARFLIQEAAALSRQQAKKLAQHCATARKKTLLEELKSSGIGQGARSGQHGIPHSRAGAQLIREGNLLPKGPFRDALKESGKQLIERGKGISH